MSRPTKRDRSDREMRAAFENLVRRNPRVAHAVLTILELVAESDRRALRLVEAIARIVSGLGGRR